MRTISSRILHNTFQRTVVTRPQFLLRAVALDSKMQPKVILTREKGKNDPVRKMLEFQGVDCLEMPLVETAPGPDVYLLPQLLQEESFDWVCITSPEAASVFAEGWKKAGKPSVRIGVVGKGTGRILEAMKEPDLVPAFSPSVANADHFGPELPKVAGGNGTVLYPCSAKASTVLQQGLEKRGFIVKRLNTYNTRKVVSLDGVLLEKAKSAQVIAIASPSAVKAWVQHVGIAVAAGIPVAAIGSTSARAAKGIGIENVYYPDKPGLDTFVETIVGVLGKESAKNEE